MSLKDLSRSLRANSTDAEKKLWQYLRKKQLAGFKFRRQVVIEPYIVDFACLEAKLIIELDGGQHQDNKEYDSIRDEFLTKRGYKILRFWNNEVHNYIESIIIKIEKDIKRRVKNVQSINT